MNDVTGLRLINLRCLRDTDHIRLRPLTFLVGVNSSGKSSFLRSLPLLRQSVEARTAGPILWYGHYVDFGNFEETISAGAAPEEIAFEFSVSLQGERERAGYEPIYYRAYPVPRLLKSTQAKFLLAVNQAEEGRTTAKRFRITLDDDNLEVSLLPDGSVSSITVNGQKVASEVDKFHLVPEGKFFQQVSREESTEGEESVWVFSDMDATPFRKGFFERKLIAKLEPFFSKSTSATNKLRLIASIPIGSKEEMLEALRNFPKTTKYWKKHISSLRIDSEDYQTIRNLFFASRLSALLSAGDRIITSFAREIRYIAPVRATVERYYRAQGLATDEIDAQGKNLAVYLQSLTLSQRTAFSKWTEEQIGFSVKVVADGDHLSLRLQEVGSSQEYNMTDMGFGFSQIMPILAQIWSSGIARNSSQRSKSRSSRIVAIEQPELHLHPRLQARVADLFAASVGQSKSSDVKVSIIAETHSEAMINRLGQLVARGKLDSNDVQVIVFNKPDPESRTNVSVATFTSDGSLTNWPMGFFLPEEE